MDINAVLKGYDALWGEKDPRVSYEYLVKYIDEALDEGDCESAATLMNEMIGMCRDAGFKDEGLKYSALAIELFGQMGMLDSVAFGTTLINVANGCRAYGLFDKANTFYDEAQKIYERHLSPEAAEFAGLYNNRSLLCQEQEDYLGAVSMLLKALEIIDTQPQKEVEQATTRGNIAQSLIALARQIGEGEASYEAVIIRAEIYLREALDRFEALGGSDFHYSGTLAAAGDLSVIKGDRVRAAAYYKRAAFLLNKYVGKSEAYDRIIEKLKECDNSIKKNLDVCREFYENAGAKMIHEHFPEFEQKIAVGMVGEGSDCLGFDDDISTDHDYGTGFCMWVSDETYEKIGRELEEIYEKLTGEVSERFNKRRGVFRINAFYEDLLGVAPSEIDRKTLMLIPEYKLKNATNGEVFCDPEGLFTQIRNKLLEHYPEDVFRKRLAEKLHDFSQYLQSNYPRMMGRGDCATASICVAKGAQTAMEIAFLLDRQYAPYYKWLRRGLNDLTVLNEMGELIDKLLSLPVQKEAWFLKEYSAAGLNTDDEVVLTGEKIAGLILREMNAQNIVSGSDAFLEIYTEELLKGGFGD